MPFFKVCASQDINQDKPAKFNLNNTDILVAKSSDNKIWAFDSICSHADKSLEKGKWNPQTAEITCPFHKAIFAIAQQGAVKAPPAFVALPVYNVELRFENNTEFIYVELD